MFKLSLTSKRERESACSFWLEHATLFDFRLDGIPPLSCHVLQHKQQTKAYVEPLSFRASAPSRRSIKALFAACHTLIIPHAPRETACMPHVPPCIVADKIPDSAPGWPLLRQISAWAFSLTAAALFSLLAVVPLKGRFGLTPQGASNLRGTRAFWHLREVSPLRKFA